MGIVKRVRKALEKGGAQPRSTRGLPLTARVAALSTGGRSTSSRGGNNSDDGPDGTGESDEGEVIVVGTGRAIEKTLNVAAWFQKQSDCQVSLRTRSVAAVDDIVLGRANNTNADGDWDIDADPDDADGEQEDEVDPDAEEHSRIRMMSCLEVSVRLRGM
jgi:ribonuclease P/MRP protein subunit POP7